MVTIEKSGIRRDVTCAQWVLMGTTGSGWSLISADCDSDYTKLIRSPFASYDFSATIVNNLGAQTYTATINNPGGEVLVGQKKTLSLIVVEPASGVRTISAGTTVGGTDLVDNERINSNQSFEYGFNKYFPLGVIIYFTVSAPCAIRLALWD